MVTEPLRPTNRRAVAVLASALALSAALAGCGGSGGGHPSASTSSTAAGPAAVAKTAPDARSLRRTESAGTVNAVGGTSRRTSAHHLEERLRKALVGYVACLKSRGVRTPGATTKAGLPSLRGVDTHTPQFSAAARGCQKAAAGVFRRSG